MGSSPQSPHLFLLPSLWTKFTGTWKYSQFSIYKFLLLYPEVWNSFPLSSFDLSFLTYETSAYISPLLKHSVKAEIWELLCHSHLPPRYRCLIPVLALTLDLLEAIPGVSYDSSDMVGIVLMEYSLIKDLKLFLQSTTYLLKLFSKTWMKYSVLWSPNSECSV